MLSIVLSRKVLSIFIMRMNGISNHAEYHDDNFTAANILMLREKIISTDELIRSYNVEREANEKRVAKEKELISTVGQLNNDCIKYENQLGESLREVQRFKESAKKLQEQNSKYSQQIKDLENKLIAGEKLTQQYEALLKCKEEQKDQNYVEKDEMDKQINKREKEIVTMKERLMKTDKKLHERIARSQKLLKGYNTSVRHLLKFGKKLAKHKATSKVDQKIIEYYCNIISKQKHCKEQDDNELDISQFSEESHTELSDNSFEIVEEKIITSPYKSTVSKTNSFECNSPSPKRKCNDSLVLTPHKNSDEAIKCNSGKLLEDLTIVQATVNNSMQTKTQKQIDNETVEHTSENFKVAECMPVINENHMYHGNVCSQSEKSFIDDDAEMGKKDLENTQLTEKDVQFEKTDKNLNCSFYVTSNCNSENIAVCNYNENNLDLNLESVECNRQGIVLNRIEKQVACNKISSTDIEDIENTHKELEDEIARITYDMCCQGLHFNPLSPLPPTPPPRHDKSGNLESTNISNHNNDVLTSDEVSIPGIINSSPKKLKRKLDFNVTTNTCDNDFDKAAEHTNGTQKLHHQHSQGFDVLSDDITYSNPNIDSQYTQSGQHQNQPSGSDSITESRFNNNAPPQIRQNPESTSQQPFQANILHCPIDGNFKINIRMANIPNERKDHKVTSLNLEVNNITREFNISCSRIPFEHNSSVAETAKCPCCANNFTEQVSNAQCTTETSCFMHQIDACRTNALPRAHLSRDTVKPVMSSSLKPVSHFSDVYKPKKHSERCDRIRNAINEDVCSVPSSDIGAELIQEPVLDVFEGLHKITDVNRSNFVPKPSSYLPRSTVKRQKTQNIYMEQPQVFSPNKSALCTEPASPCPSKQSYNIDQNIRTKKTKPSSKQNDDNIQNTSCIIQTKPLNTPKNVPSAEQKKPFLSKQKCYAITQVSSTVEKTILSTGKKDTNEIFPISRRLTSNKRLLSDAEGGRTADNKVDTSIEQPQSQSKKCKLNTKTDNTIVDHFSKLGRNIYEVKSSIPKTMEELQQLKQGSVNKASRKLQLKLANPHQTLSTDAFVHSALVFLANTQKNPFINFSSESSPPLLTEFEQNLLAVLQFLETKSYSHLKNVTTGLKIALLACIFSKNKRNTLFGNASMCRTYVALCRQNGELEEARLLCYDLFCKLPNNALYLVTSSITIWPDILITQHAETVNKINLLQNIYKYLLLKGSHTLNRTLFGQCMTVLKILCNISSPFNDIVALGKYIIATLEDSCAEEIQDTCAEIKFKLNEASMAIELLAIQAGLVSQVKEFVDDLMISTFNTWRQQLIHKTKKYEILLTFWLKVFGAIGNHCFHIQDCFENIISILCEVLVSLEASFSVQESAFISLLTLQPLCKQSYMQKISSWLLQHEQNLSDDGKAFIEKIKLKSVLAILPSKEQVT